MIKIATEKTLDENATNNSSEINQLRLKIISSATATLPKLKGTWWFKRNPDEIEHLFTNIWAFGPSRAKLNIFFDHSTKQGSDKDSPASNFGIHNCIWNSNLRQIEQTIGKVIIYKNLVLEHPSIHALHVVNYINQKGVFLKSKFSLILIFNIPNMIT